MKQTFIDRTTQDWSRIAQEPVTVEATDGALYGFCSELGALRIFYKYRHCGDAANAEYSANLETWFFRLEVKI